MRARRPGPLQRQLTALAAVVLALGLVMADIATTFAITDYLNERLDATLRDTPVFFLEDVAGTAGQGVKAADHDADPSTGPRTMPFLQLSSAGGAGLRTQAGSDASGNPFTVDLPSVLPSLAWSDIQGGPAAFFDARSREPAGPRLRVKISTDAQGRILVVALPRTDTDALLGRLRLVLACVSAGALLLASVAASWLVRRRLGPLRRLADVVDSLGFDDPAARVPVDTTSREVHELALATNAMLQRIHDARAKEQAGQDRLRQFIADASHELRTPIAAVSAYAQLFELGAKNNPADLARSMSGIQHETARMRDLTEKLLTLGHHEEDMGHQTQTADLAAVIGQAVDAALTVDPSWPVTAAPEPRIGAVAADPTQLRQVLDNLIGNVRFHTPPGTSTHIQVQRQGSNAVIAVADHGPGLTQDERAHMFDRFWRKDLSRSRATGGSGLGLAIVAAIVTSWDGEVTASKTPGGGLTVTFTVPIAPTRAHHGTAPPT